MIALSLMWLRAAGLVSQAIALGGAAFGLLVLPAAAGSTPDRARARTFAATCGASLGVAFLEIAVLAVLTAAFADDGRWPLAAVLFSTTGRAGAVRIAAAGAGAWVAWTLRRHPRSTPRVALLLFATALLPLTGALASHAMGRLDRGWWLVGVAAGHQAAGSVWAGGLICALFLSARLPLRASVAWLRPFSALAAASVAALAVTGIALSVAYVGSPGAAIGTSYGAMVLAKVALFAALLVMGALNHRVLHGNLARGPAPWRAASTRDRRAPMESALALRRRLEVDAGLAVVTLLLAASIASAPPGAEAGTQRASPGEVGRVLAPHWPRLVTPSLAELAATSGLGDASVPRTPEETAWSEFGHNVSGLFILAMGLLATLERTGRAPWARHWPLLFIGLSAFVAWSLDPEGWQTGFVGFWEQLRSPEVLQHRFMLGLTALFGVAEWQVRSGRRPESRWRYVFPAVCIASGVLLLSHTHDVSNAKSAFLMELTHIPLGLTILVAGWARWLELRLPGADGSGPGRVWGPALALFGLLLVFYRES